MRIAQIAPLYESVPPKLYGGTERVVAHLSNALVERGHEVTLFASGDSKTWADLVPCRDVALRLDQELSWDLPAHLAMLATVREMADAFDILHFHLDCHHFPLFDDRAHRTLTTLHGRQDIRTSRELLPSLSLFSARFGVRQPAVIAEPSLDQNGQSQLRRASTHSRRSPRRLPRLSRPLARRKASTSGSVIAERVGTPFRIAPDDFADRGYFRSALPASKASVRAEYIGEIAETEKDCSWAARLPFSFRSTGPNPSDW
jgi:glycosyltransferase involved in cell wall biosynthesis